ncbi:hypothetical protein QNH46_06440 [Paenibacillus woosongensis]|uniref:Uncharacterized protein n=1 Tax=Paenibacillus woosongensis TaxID=307580 RepID=A0AA95ICE1_9BACL|nr:hypothetical protein [Paenibacillus woosongensis]WHX50300.1 hypothetical protein QNH46_06440 [Paenibacillus woosongensis]
MDKEQSKDTATWFPQPTYFTGGEGKGYGAMPERGEVLYLHFPGSNEEINYVISSDGSDYDSIAKRIQASTQNPEPPESKKKPNNRAAAVPKKNRNPGQAINEDTIYRSKQWFSPGNKSLLLDDHQVKLHATDGASQITLLDGTGIIVSSTGSMELTAKNLRVNPDFVGEQGSIPAEGVNVMLTAGKNVILLCEGSSMMMDEQDGSIHMLSETVRLESPENPMDIQVMSGDEVEALLAEYEQMRLGYQPVFLSDGTLVSSDNNDVLYNYFIKYVYKPDDQGTSPEKMFKAWRLEYYGKNSNEKKREYYGKSAEFVVKGNYADEVTGLGVGTSILLGVTGVDLLADGRDLVHNFTHWEWSWGHIGEVGLNSLGLVPVIGAVKNLKYSDDVLALAKQAGNADDFIKGLNKMGALVDEAGNKFALRKLADGSYELINESGKVVKKIDGLPSAINELGVKIGKGNGEVGTPPRYGDRQISQEEYDILRDQTPTRELRDKVNEGHDKKVITQDEVLPGKTFKGALEADHVVSMDRITRMDGFGKLTDAQKLEVLNNPENFIALSKSANTSKQSKSFEEWTHYKKGKPGEIEVNPEFREKMIVKEKELERKLQKQIDEFNELNSKNKGDD